MQAPLNAAWYLRPGLGWLGDCAQGGVHARVGEVVARGTAEDHARQLPVRARAADGGVRVGAAAAERLSSTEDAWRHASPTRCLPGSRTPWEPVCCQGSRCSGLPAAEGALAQLVERLHGMQEVRGSNPLSSTGFPSLCSIISD